MTSGLFTASFILLASTTLDNVRETVEWFDFMRATGLSSWNGKLVDSMALLVATLLSFFPFLICAWLARFWAREKVALWTVARQFGWSLIPIGIAYVLGHNMPLLMTGLPRLVQQITEGVGLGLFDSYQASPLLVWILEIGLVVGGHVMGVVAAHRIALRVAGSHQAAVKSHVALTVLMSFFTVSTLWLLSLPLVTTS